MAHSTLIIAESGTGKSTSIRNLPANETFIINIANKSLPFKGWKSKYKLCENSNLKNVNFKNSVIVNANFRNTTIENTNFSYTNLFLLKPHSINISFFFVHY